MTDIFREIDEELRRENFAKLWARYGSYVIALVVVIVVATAGVVGWRQWQNRERRAEGVQYAAALDLAQAGKTAEAASAFSAIARTAGGGHAMLARFEEAAMRVRQGNLKAAVQIYDALAQDASLGQTYRTVALLLSARYGLETGDPKAAIARVKPLTDAANPWHATAIELTALAQLKSGDKTAALDSYKRLIGDASVPRDVRTRAREMVVALSQ